MADDNFYAVLARTRGSHERELTMLEEIHRLRLSAIDAEFNRCSWITRYIITCVAFLACFVVLLVRSKGWR